MVDIHFEHKGNIITLPINPQELKIDVPGDNENANVIGLGEINILKKPRLTPISISSFFPENENPQKYINFFSNIQNTADKMRLVCSVIGLNMLVGIDGFSYAIRAGEEGDRYYTLEMQEYRPYEIKQIKPEPPVLAITQIPTPPTPPLPVTDYSTGDIIEFKGGNHYVSSVAKTPTGGIRTAGKAKITNKAMAAPHPYHLIGVSGGSNVYGWVDRETVNK